MIDLFPREPRWSQRKTDIFTKEKMKDFELVSRFTGGKDLQRPTKRKVHDVKFKGRVVETCGTLQQAKDLIKKMVNEGTPI